MSTITVMEFTKDDLQETGAFIYKATVSELYRNKFLTEEQASELLNEWVPLYHPKGSFSKLLDRFFKKDEDSRAWMFTLCKHGKKVETNDQDTKE